MNINSPTDVFFDQMRDLHSAETQVIETLGELPGFSSDAGLKELLRDQHRASRDHHSLLKSIFAAHHAEPGNDVCKAIAGLIEGGNQHLEAAAPGPCRNLLLIAHCGRIAHYQIAAYRFTTAMAGHLGWDREHDALAGILGDKINFDRELVDIAWREFALPVEVTA